MSNVTADKDASAREARIAVGLVVIANAVDSWHRTDDEFGFVIRGIERLNAVEALLGVEAVQLAVRDLQA